MRADNAPHPIEDRPTRRFDLRQLEVHRIFDEAAIEEAAQALEARPDPVGDLRKLALGLAISFC